MPVDAAQELLVHGRDAVEVREREHVALLEGHVGASPSVQQTRERAHEAVRYLIVVDDCKKSCVCYIVAGCREGEGWDDAKNSGAVPARCCMRVTYRRKLTLYTVFIFKF